MADDRDLVPIPGFPFPVLASPGVEVRAGQIATRCANAYRFLGGVFGLQPDVTLMVLAERDWPGGDRPYGMPHYERRTLVVAGEDAGFWRGFVPLLEKARSDLLARARSVYGSDIDLGSFFDLLAVHELAHAFAERRADPFPRHWLNELFANLCLHSFVASDEAQALPRLVAFPAAFVTLDPIPFPHTTLDDFEQLYSDMDGLNYGWYQCHFHVAAGRLHDAEGVESMRKFWAGSFPPDPMSRSTRAGVFRPWG